VENKQEYLDRLQAAIQQLHQCEAFWKTTVPVHEVFQSHTVWKGMVEVFEIAGHPKAKRAYGWSLREHLSDGDERFVTVLELPPVESAETAVRASVMADIKRS
jgi:hypothetical protein